MPETLATSAGVPWIRSRRWDLTWLLGSAAIVPLVLAFVWGGASSRLINLGVTALVGGPHLFATYLVTFGDPRFRRRHAVPLALLSLLIPAFVVWLTFTDFQVLLSLFIFLASFHVLQQNAYLTDVYRRRAGLAEAPSARLIDYGLLLICIYPIAAWKLVHGEFRLGEVEILIPAFLKNPWTYRLTWAAFAVFLALWIQKTRAEARAGCLNRPKTLLIAVTATVAFLVPAAASGRRLELAFQAVNAWHSVQYLGIVWLVMAVRRERGLLETRWARALSGPGRRPALLFYGACLAVTLALFALVFALAAADPWRLSFDRYYYMGVLSCLLIHYAFDAWFFFAGNLEGARIEDQPFAAPAKA